MKYTKILFMLNSLLLTSIYAHEIDQINLEKNKKEIKQQFTNVLYASLINAARNQVLMLKTYEQSKNMPGFNRVNYQFLNLFGPKYLYITSYEQAEILEKYKNSFYKDIDKSSNQDDIN